MLYRNKVLGRRDDNYYYHWRKWTSTGNKVNEDNSGKTSAMDALIYSLDREQYSAASRSSSGKLGKTICY